MGMSCHECREIVSAHLDGEATPAEWERVRGHLAACASCAHFERRAEALRRSVRIAPAEQVPDLSAAILAAVAPVESSRDDPQRSLRLALLGIACVQILIAAPAVLAGDADAATAHLARHLGAFDVALAVGFLVVAYRPARFFAGTFPVAVAAVIGMVGATLVDVTSGSGASVASAEVAHVTEVAGVLAMWLLGRTASRPVLA